MTVYPAWLYYGGPAYAFEIGYMVTVPKRVWPVVDMADDNLGSGIIIALGGLDVVVDSGDIEPGMVGWMR